MMIPHESRVPFPIFGRYSQVRLQGVCDIVRIGKVEILGQVDCLEGVDELGLLRGAHGFLGHCDELYMASADRSVHS